MAIVTNLEHLAHLKHTILNASEEDLYNKKKFTVKDFTAFLKSQKYRYTGTKKDMILRVLWVRNPDKYTKPNNIMLKGRGRPSTNTSKTTGNDNDNDNDTKEITDYTQAKNKKDLKKLKIKHLKEILEKNNYRTIGKIDELVDRVWWMLHKDTEDKPSGTEKKQRGRPSFKKHYIVEFIDDDSVESDHPSYDDDDGDYDQNIWSAMFVNNGKISKLGKGKRVFKFKHTNYLFKETFNCDYIIYGKIDKDDSVHMIEIKEFDEYSKDIQTVIQNMIRDVNDSM